MAKLEVGENTRLTENDDGDQILVDIPTGNTIFRYDRSADKWVLVELEAELGRFADIVSPAGADIGLVNKDGDLYLRRF